MKKVLLIFALMTLQAGTMAQVPDIDSAAVIIREKGVYEQKRVVTVDSVKASTLYRRAMEALSEWTGTDGRSRAGLDYCDKDEGIVTYKGVYYNGYRKLPLGGTLPFYTDFILKVRCKDGRAQVTVTVPTMHTVLNDGSKRVWTMLEVLESNENADPRKTEKAKKKTEAITTREIVEILLRAMEGALKKDEEDDF